MLFIIKKQYKPHVFIWINKKVVGQNTPLCTIASSLVPQSKKARFLYNFSIMSLSIKTSVRPNFESQPQDCETHFYKVLLVFTTHTYLSGSLFVLHSSVTLLAAMVSNSTVFLVCCCVVVSNGLCDRDGESVGVGEDVPDVIAGPRTSRSHHICRGKNNSPGESAILLPAIAALGTIDI